MIANAVLDKLIHHSYIIFITRKSYRLKDKISHIKSNENWKIFVFLFWKYFTVFLDIYTDNGFEFTNRLSWKVLI